MSQAYPSKRRARRAFERGVATGFRKRDARCPYRNPKLAELWARGRELGLAGRPPQVGPKPQHPARAERPARRPFAPPAASKGRNFSRGEFGRGGGWRR